MNCGTTRTSNNATQRTSSSRSMGTTSRISTTRTTISSKPPLPQLVMMLMVKVRLIKDNSKLQEAQLSNNRHPTLIKDSNMVAVRVNSKVSQHRFKCIVHVNLRMVLSSFSPSKKLFCCFFFDLFFSKFENF